MPSLPFASPVSGRASTVYGMFMTLAALLRLELRREVLARRPARCIRSGPR